MSAALMPERVTDLEQAVRMGHCAIGVDKRSSKRRETLLALIADWQALKEVVEAKDRLIADLCISCTAATDYLNKRNRALERRLYGE